jgi:nucleoside phosphorylase
MVADPIDVLIITALEDELLAVLALGEGEEPGWKETRDRSGSTYHVRPFVNARGKRFFVAAVWLGEKRVSSFGLRMERLIEELDPTCLALCGVCAGNPDQVFLGDVVVADQVYSYREPETVDGVVKGASARDVAVSDLGTTWRIDASYFARELGWSKELAAARPVSRGAQEDWLLRALYKHEVEGFPSPVSLPERRQRCPDWTEVVQGLREGDCITEDPGSLQLTQWGRDFVLERRLLYPDGPPEDPPFRVHVGPIAAISGVIHDREIFERLKRRVRATLAIDSEAFAVGRMAVMRGRRAIIAKAVAHFPLDYREESFHDFACRASAEFLRAFLRERFEPEERPQRPAPSALRAMTGATIDRVTIRNFKNIHHLDIQLATVSELPGHWSCIAGLNGAGKSAVLQAIALVLLGDRLAPVIGDEWLKRARRFAHGEPQSAEIRAWVRNGQELIELALPLGPAGVNPRKLEAEPSYDAMRAFWDARAESHLLLSYGAGRNLSEHRDSRHATKSPDVRRQMTLFDPLTQVASVEVLLDQGERARPILAMLKRLLDIVLEGVPLSVEEAPEGLLFKVGGVAVAAAELPDGFRATIAWLADLCAAWFEKAPEEASDGDPKKIRAIVLIDEIDLHLHAGLQRELVPRLRAALPDVQWIVSTHSPLVVSSFDRRELVVLSPGPDGPEKREIDRQILAFTTDEVYRYLMEIPPRSAALDERFRNGKGSRIDERLDELMAQSPDVSEEQAKEERAWLTELAKKARERAASDPEQSSS